ncbi:GDYXXLXY domain-containing protein [Marinifilum flexuosum]|uniref:GDYXXLXY domain-containing protein n=1 Tax=Marinifilum flexuosum TaxID=1117708 RepID=UPI002492D661|nr:GDYXXLXY domain-containing protein [Marinifilum flexuosum]
MKKHKWIVIGFNLILVLFLFNKSIIEKEKILSDGKLVLLRLAPVDPRSLMQGDYMRLNYEISRNISIANIPKRGFCIVRLDENGIGTKVRLQNDVKPISDGEYAIEYTTSNRSINIGAESYFFEEGQAEKYDSAKYGGLKIYNQGSSILIGLYDENLRKIE